MALIMGTWINCAFSFCCITNTIQGSNYKHIKDAAKQVGIKKATQIWSFCCKQAFRLSLYNEGKICNKSLPRWVVSWSFTDCISYSYVNSKEMSVRCQRASYLAYKCGWWAITNPGEISQNSWSAKAKLFDQEYCKHVKMITFSCMIKWSKNSLPHFCKTKLTHLFAFT